MLEGDKSPLDHSRKILWKWLLTYLKPMRLKFFVYFIFLLIGTIITSISPILSANIIDRGIVMKDTYYIILLSSIYLSLILIMAITNYLAQYGMGKISQKITFDIRNDLFDKLQDMSLSYFDQRSSGEVISIMTNDVTLLNQLVGGQFIQIITNAVSIGLTVIFIFFLNPFLALISLVIFPLFFLITHFFKKVAIRLFKLSRKTIGKVTSSIQENIEGAKVVQAYGQEKRAAFEFDQANIANYKVMVKIRKYMATIFPFITLTTTVLTACILLAGGLVVLGNVTIFGFTVTVGVLSAFITILGQFFRPFMSLMQIQQIIESAMAASDRIYSLLEEKVEIPDPIIPELFKQIDGAIDFNNISFGYSFNNNAKEQEYMDIQLMEQNKYANTIPPENIIKLAKILERSLQSKAGLQQSGGIGGEGGDMISKDMRKSSPEDILNMLANTSIPPEINNNLPKIVKDAIKEQKILIQYKKSKGFVVKDLSLKISPGTTLAIVGETGAGKTTLIKLIARFYDLIEGKILIDGVDISKVRKKDLRDLIGIVPQDAYLFSGTIRENLLYAFDNYTPQLEEKMIQVSKFLGLHNFIDALHKKYDTRLKENGSNISIGQRQLIAFARALITDPKILILDEATSSVDPYTETLIQDALNKAREGRTTIIIAHRLSTIKNADFIIVLNAEKKGIIEQGDHDRLIALNGKYKRLLEMQHRDIELQG
ncbi:MAG: ATP-binding cassette domain-containing protein [Promethearchaeota archaeon]|nr:MAG: ATP-binding cassette domain-containing protein [Candidatus Lokiarchaeota archaeon]